MRERAIVPAGSAEPSIPLAQGGDRTREDDAMNTGASAWISMTDHASAQNAFDAWDAVTREGHIRDFMNFSHLFVQQFSLVADRVSSYSGSSLVASRASC